MKLRIKVLTEWDRENVIPFFEKHFPNCNEIMGWVLSDIHIGDLLWVDKVNDLRNNNIDIPSDYTILQGVPKDMELPKTREQELEQCLKNIVSCTRQSGNGRNRLNDNKLGKFHIAIEQAKQLLNK